MFFSLLRLIQKDEMQGRVKRPWALCWFTRR